MLTVTPLADSPGAQYGVTTQPQADNRPEVRAARSLVIREMDRIAQAIRDGMNVDQLSPMELSLDRYAKRDEDFVPVA